MFKYLKRSLFWLWFVLLPPTDYLVDEGTECNATSDLLLERNREESLIALLIPSLLLLNNLLQKLQVCMGLIRDRCSE